MNRKKLLAIAVSILTTITPNLNIAAMTENQNVSKTFVFISQNTPETFLAEYSRDGIELPPFSPINTNYLFFKKIVHFFFKIFISFSNINH